MGDNLVVAFLVLHAFAASLLGGTSKDLMIRSVMWRVSAFFWIAAGIWRIGAK